MVVGGPIHDPRPPTVAQVEFAGTDATLIVDVEADGSFDHPLEPGRYTAVATFDQNNDCGDAQQVEAVRGETVDMEFVCPVR